MPRAACGTRSHLRRRRANLARGGQGMLRIPVESRASRTASAWVEVDLGAIAHNVRVLRSVLAPGARLIAVVKSDGYGHGMLRVARAALGAGADELAVASVAEGAALRTAGIAAKILVAGPIAAEQAHAVVQHGLVVGVGCHEVAAALARATRRFFPVQIEVDTGMSRHGVAPGELMSFVDVIEARGRLAISGVFTHLSGVTADDLPRMRRQLAQFTAAVDGVRSLRGVRRHVCNTLGALLLPEAAFDGVRIGGGLYGFDPLAGAGPVRLRPALSLKARIVGLRKAAVGERVGYGGTFTCRRPSRLATLPIGYGDGLVRELWRGAEVLVRGRRAPIVGEISMNQTVVDCTDLPEVVFGEEVVLLGSIGGEEVAVADRVPPGGSAYEVTSVLQPRLPRVYVGADRDREGRDPTEREDPRGMRR
ncbi:MAG TPA: alanine racemase [bacterium]|nr:alanine racemase [bacterium]